LAGVIELLFEIVHRVTQALGYPGIFFLMLVENLFPPMPSEMVMPFGGFIAAEGDLQFLLVLLFGTAGSVLGAQSD
jgi:membrane protein DedA with SNARE-associated domain